MRRRSQSVPHAQVSFRGVLLKEGGGPPSGALVVRVVHGDKELARRPVDGNGRFLLPVLDGRLEGKALGLYVLHQPTGETVGKFMIVYPPKGQVGQETFVLPRRRGAPQGRIAGAEVPAPAAVSRDVVARAWRTEVAKLLQGRVPDKDGRPLVPRAVNAAIVDLNDAAYLSRRILSGDLGSADNFLAEIGYGRGGAGMGPAPSSGGRPGGSAMSARRFGRSDQLPCVFQGGGALDVALAGLILDVYRAEVLGDLTQPGAYTEAATSFLHQQYGTLRGFGDAAGELARGGMSAESFHRRVYGTPGDPFGPGGSGGPGGPGGSGGGPLGEPFLTPDPLGDPPALPGEPSRGPGGGALPCDDLMWVDCVDEIGAAARGYTLPARCADEDDIGSISPAAICQGATDVEIEIRPKAGRQFSGDGASCRAFLQRSEGGVPLLNRRKELQIISYSATLVKVKLAAADWSGCIGLRGTGGGMAGNPGFIRSCLKMGRIHSPMLERLHAPGGGTLRQIACTGANLLAVVPPPQLRSLSAAGPEGSSTETTGSAVYLVAESCRSVTLSWQFGFDDPLVDPADFIAVSVQDGGGTEVAAGLAATDSLVVQERLDAEYTITARAMVDGAACSERTAVATIERFEALHLEGADALRSGTAGSYTVRSSCAAPSGGLAVKLSSSDTARLSVPATVTIAAGQNTAVFAAAAPGAGCAQVVLSATAVDHLGATRAIELFDTPQITSMSPTTVNSCRPVTLTLSGSCFNGDDLLVRARQAGAANPDLAFELLDSSTIRVTADSIPPGEWRIEVRSHGLFSTPALLQVNQTLPAVDSFVALVAGQIVGGETVNLSPSLVPCVPNWIAVSWSVRDTSRVVVRLDGDVICAEDDADSGCGPQPGCGGPFSGGFTSLLDQSATFRLEAFPVDGGNPVIREVTVGEAGIHRMTLINNSNKDLVIWVYDAGIIFMDDVPHNSPKTDLPSGGQITLTFGDCEFRDVAKVDKAAALADGYDPYGDAIEIAHLASVLFQDVIGSDDGQDVTFGI